MPAKWKNISLQQFGRLMPSFLVGKRHNYYWACLCDCGNTAVVKGSEMVSGNTQSCGCLQRELQSVRARNQFGINSHRFKHGLEGSPTYSSWCNMRTRCTNSNFHEWKNYGGAGVTVCERWLQSFEAFLEDMGLRPENTSLGRFGDIGDYEPGNCAWQTRAEQAAERKKHYALIPAGEKYAKVRAA